MDIKSRFEQLVAEKTAQQVVKKKRLPKVPPVKMTARQQREARQYVASQNAKARWSNATPEERAAQRDKMNAGREAARLRREQKAAVERESDVNDEVEG